MSTFFRIVHFRLRARSSCSLLKFGRDGTAHRRELAEIERGDGRLKLGSGRTMSTANAGGWVPVLSENRVFYNFDNTLF